MRTERRGNGMALLGAGLAIGLAAGVALTGGHKPATATSPKQSLQQEVNNNAVNISKLRRQLRALTKQHQALAQQYQALGRKVEGNRRATRTIASRNGVRIRFEDN